VARGAREQRIERTQVEELQRFRPLDRPLEPIRRKERRQIEQGARHRGDRNPLALGDVIGFEASRVDSNARLGPALARGDEMERVRPVAE
jgi:hypothetical protein